MRKVTLGLIALILSTSAIAQVSYDTVTATVTDPDGHLLSNAPFSWVLVDSLGNRVSSATTPNGQIYNAAPVRGNLSNAGVMSVQLVPNGILTRPSNTQWQLAITPPLPVDQSNILTYQPPWNLTYNTTISAPVDLSAQISAQTNVVNFFNTQTGQSTLAGWLVGSTDPPNKPCSASVHAGYLYMAADGNSFQCNNAIGGTYQWNPVSSTNTVTGMATISNIAALRSYAGNATALNVIGYYSATTTSAPDGGGGIFIDQGAGASADDNGITIYDTVTGHNWKRQIPAAGRIIDAWFGSKNDNSTDNAAAIQAGWNYMCAARAGKFQFQNGKIRFGSTLVKQCTFDVSGTGWNINGATYGTTLIYTGNVSPAISYHNNASIYTYAFDSLHDVGLAYAGSATSTWINAIEFGNPQDSLMLNGTIDHIAFDGFPGSGFRFTFTAPTTWAATFTGYISDGTGAAPGNILCVPSGTPVGNYLNGAGVPVNTFIVGNVSAGVHPKPAACTGPGAGTAYYLNPETSLNITSETLRSNYGSGTYYQNLSITNIWDQGLGQLIGADNYYMNSANVLTLSKVDHENAQSTSAGLAHAYIDLTAIQGKTVDRVIYEGATDSSPYLFALGQMDGYGTDISNIWIENGSMAHPMTGLADFIFQSYPGPYAKFSKLNLLPNPAFTGATFNFSDYVTDAHLVVDNGPYDFSEGPHSSNNLITVTAGQGFSWSKNVISKVQACGSVRAEAIVDPAVMQLCSTVPDVYVNEHGLFLPGFAKGPLSVTVTGAATQGIVSDAIQGRVFEANFSGVDPNITFTVQPTADMVGSQITLGINWDFVTAQTAYGICPILSNYPFGVGQGTTMTSGVGTGTLAGASCVLSDVPHNVWQTTFTTLNVLSTSPITYTFPRMTAGPAPSGTQTLRFASVYLGSGPQIPYTTAGANALQPLDMGYCASPPAYGTYIVGDHCTNSAPASGQPSAWVVTTAPSTWKPLANIP